MQEAPTRYRMTVHMGDTSIVTEHRYSWEQAQEINELIQTSAQEAIGCDAIVPMPMRRKDPGDEDFQVVAPTSSDTPRRQTTKWVFEFNTTDTRILQVAAATAIVAAGIGIGVAAVAGVVGLVWV